MSTLYTITIENHSSSFQNFFVFQEPANYTGGAKVYSNSLWSQGVLPSSEGGSSATFLMLQQYYAGVQQQVTPPKIGEVSGYSSAIQPIDITTQPPQTTTKNTTNLILEPALGLAPPTNNPEVPAGNYRIITPTFNPIATPYNAGLASQSPTGQVTLSNFIIAEPNQNIDCQPILKFYLQTGKYEAGNVINFTTSSTNAAMCDATTGYATFKVVYNIDGTWTVIPSGVGQLMPQP